MNIEEAIETVKGITEDDLLNYWEGPEEPYDAIQIVLNLIKKQQKEIEELKKENEPQPDCAEPIERTEEMVNMKWVNYNYISKDKIKELREIDNIDLIQFKIKELLGE